MYYRNHNLFHQVLSAQAVSSKVISEIFPITMPVRGHLMRGGAEQIHAKWSQGGGRPDERWSPAGRAWYTHRGTSRKHGKPVYASWHVPLHHLKMPGNKLLPIRSRGTTSVSLPKLYAISLPPVQASELCSDSWHRQVTLNLYCKTHQPVKRLL